ncbi:hypothetical protein [Leisingera methylohalidivorans]|uniref:Uncharacterized protein n=1 Tax=Leisingera methylohalidivorans DSM 14336 TaxID=999552 RepID=V9W142_9RHOB|nr:hypothetical protein [Leisingera methylohalidivorans]AHD03375.1 hypothetical protein METH_21360 [Leisingera methylohalidivorans DSM 14336]
MIRFDEDTALKLNSRPFPVRFNGEDYRIVAQDPGGLVDVFRTPERTAQALLTPEQFRIWAAIAKSGGRGLPLRQLAARTGLKSVPNWVTIENKWRRLNRTSLSINYTQPVAPTTLRHTDSRQPKDTNTWILQK